MQMKVKNVSELEPAFQPMTEEWVVRQIQERQETGQEINSATIKRECATLYGRAESLLGGWDNALSAAGIDPTEVKLLKRPESWTAKKVLERIRQRHRSGKLLKHKMAKEEAPSLAAAAKNYFDGWYSAVLEAGFDPRKIKGKWSKKKVLGRISQKKEAGEQLNSAAVKSQDPPLHGAALRYFQSWPKALRAAGIDPKKQDQSK